MRDRRVPATLGITTPPVWADPGLTFSEGPTQNRNTSGAFARLTGAIYTKIPLLLTGVQWYTRKAGTYTLRFVTTFNGTTPLLTITTSQACSAATLTTFVPDVGALPVLLRPGVTYYLQLTLDSGTDTWSDYNSDNYDGTYWQSWRGVYYTTSAYASYTIPAVLSGVAFPLRYRRNTI